MSGNRIPEKFRQSLPPGTESNGDKLFCTECGEELDYYFISDEAKDLEAIKIRHSKCKKSGRFKSEFCARMFITGQYDDDDVFPDED